MRVQEILSRKGDSVYQISPDATLAEAVDRLVNFNIGSLLVSDGESIYGIITERDIMKVIADSRRPLSEVLVHEQMTSEMVTGEPNDNVNDIMGTMTSRRVRHLPIMDNGRLAGMISIGDIVKAQYELLVVENHYLREYIQS
ncbi:MAG: CBS domain-containing protein [Planctomycetota bacterium]|nr:CBS domain-containing protein [Planctomycetota bacterium]